MTAIQASLNDKFKYGFIEKIKHGFMLTGSTGTIMKPANSSIGSRIRNRRLALNLTQQALAAKVGVSVQAISQWESNKTTPEAARLARLVEVLGTDVAHILVGHPPLSQPLKQTGTKAPILNAYHLVNIARYELPEVPENTPWLDVSTEVEGVAFAVRIPNRSNEPLFKIGDLAIFDTSGPFARPGDMVIAREGSDSDDFSALNPHNIDMESLPIGRLRSRGLDDGQTVMDIVPLNPDFPTATFSYARPGMILGVMIEHRRLRTSERPLSAA
ncbi:helix-turn-helix domain-containing protein [Xanthobacteraceae bacterium A53D]